MRERKSFSSVSLNLLARVSCAPLLRIIEWKKQKKKKNFLSLLPFPFVIRNATRFAESSERVSPDEPTSAIELSDGITRGWAKERLGSQAGWKKDSIYIRRRSPLSTRIGRALLGGARPPCRPGTEKCPRPLVCIIPSPPFLTRTENFLTFRIFLTPRLEVKYIYFFFILFNM